MIDILFPVDSGLKVLEHLHQKILILLYFTISKSHFIIISKKKKQKSHFIIIPSHFTILPASQNFIFIKILFFNIFLLFLYNCHFFFIFIFPELSNSLFFFSSPSPSTSSNTQAINNHSHGTKNPSHRSETQATDQPINNHSHGTENPSAHAADLNTQSKPIKKKIITRATIGATNDQPNQSTDPPFQTHHQPILAHQSKPSSPIHDER